MSQSFRSRELRPTTNSSPATLATSSRSFRDRVPRFDAGTASRNSTKERPLGSIASYAIHRDNRLSSFSKPDEAISNRSYRKMYDSALAENEELKSKLDGRKQELAHIQSQLKNLSQVRMTERSSVLEEERRETRILQRKVLQMEDKFMELKELKSENQRLKDENGALIRVISKLSK